MANYGAPLLQVTVTTAYKTAGFVWSVGLRRIQVYEIEFGQAGSLASTDIQVQWDISRGITGALGGSAVVPNLFDLSDTSPSAQFLNGATTEPTYSAINTGLSIKNWGINQRGSYRWRALDDGDNIIIPATSATGIGARQLSPGGPITGMSAVGNLSFVER